MPSCQTFIVAVQLSNTSDITAREGSSFERECNALRERKMETILEPGETPLRTAEGNTGDARSRFAPSADGEPVLVTPRQVPGGAADEAGSPSSTRSKHWLARTASQKWLEGQETPRPASLEILPVSFLWWMWQACPLQTILFACMHPTFGCILATVHLHAQAQPLDMSMQVSVLRGRQCTPPKYAWHTISEFRQLETSDTHAGTEG